MAGITTNGIGSGLDINDLVGQLVAAEIEPTTQRLDREQASALARISAFGLIKSALAELDSAASGMTSASDFRSSTVSSSNEDVLTAVSTDGSARGNLSVKVQRLAETHRLVMQDGVAGPSSAVGTGTLTITVGSDAFTVDVDGSNDTLGGIRDAINQAEGNTGVNATIIKVDDGFGGKTSKLLLNAQESGEASRISISVDDDDGLDADAGGLSRLSDAQLVDPSPVNLDALVEIDGETVTSASNTLDDVVEGLSLTLVSADPDNAVAINAGEDRSSAIDKVRALVDSFNTVVGVLRDATRVAPNSGESGVLVGDATARFMETRLRNAINTAVDSVQSVFGSLGSIGITTGNDGTLQLDESELESALARDFDGVVSLFSASDGVAARLGSQLTEYLDFQGVIETRTDGLSTQLGGINERRASLAARESALEARYLAQFSAMDALVASLQATGDFLTQQIDALNGNN